MTIDLKTATYNVLRKYAIELGLDLGRNPLKPVIIKAIEEKLALKVKAAKPKASKIAVNKEVKAESTNKLKELKSEDSASVDDRTIRLQFLLIEYVTASKENRVAIKDTVEKEKQELIELSEIVADGIVVIDKTKLVLESMDTILTVEAEEVAPDKASWLDSIVTSVSTSPTNPSWMDEFLNANQSSNENDEKMMKKKKMNI